MSDELPPTDPREMLQYLPFPSKDGRFPPQLGAVVQTTVTLDCTAHFERLRTFSSRPLKAEHCGGRWFESTAAYHQAFWRNVWGVSKLRPGARISCAFVLVLVGLAVLPAAVHANVSGGCTAAGTASKSG